MGSAGRRLGVRTELRGGGIVGEAGGNDVFVLWSGPRPVGPTDCNLWAFERIRLRFSGVGRDSGREVDDVDVADAVGVHGEGDL